jgi:hypothetical protein
MTFGITCGTVVAIGLAMGLLVPAGSFSQVETGPIGFASEVTEVKQVSSAKKRSKVKMKSAKNDQK